MDVRKFEAPSMRAVVQKVRDEFGIDAVILKTAEKRQPTGGRVFEITAARPEVVQGARRGPESPLISKDVIDIQRSITKIEGRLESLASQMAYREQLLGLDGRLDDIRQLVLMSLGEGKSDSFKTTNKHILGILHYLQLMGVDHSLVSKIGQYLDGLPEPGNAGEVPEEYYRAFAIRWLLKRVQIAPLFDASSEVPKMQLFVGPYGSGKTSMVTKTAFHLSKVAGQVPLVVSFNQSSLGAADNLRVYCKVLGIEFKAISTLTELVAINKANRDSRPILVDSEAINPKNSATFKYFDEVRSAGLPLDVVLVLSLSDKSDYLENVVKAVSSVGIDALSFTRLDVCWSYGDVLNLSQKWGLSVVSFGTGPRVPEDLERATRERVAERIFGLGKD